MNKQFESLCSDLREVQYESLRVVVTVNDKTLRMFLTLFLVAGTEFKQHRIEEGWLAFLEPAQKLTLVCDSSLEDGEYELYTLKLINNSKS